MKLNTLPVKRTPVKNGLFKRLRAVTGSRKQRAAAAPTTDMDVDDGGSKISRALVIVFLFHIVAIGLIFVHHNFLDSRKQDSPVMSDKAASQTAMNLTPLPVSQADLPRIEPGEKSVVVTLGDNYARIAAREGVDESDLKAINEQVDLKTGILLKIPAKRPVISATPNLLPPSVDEAEGLVDVVQTSAALVVPRAVAVKPKSPLPAATTTSSGKSYAVQPGDSIWRIANKFKVKQEALLKANALGKDGKIKTGMTLVIPH
jgi:LysM repeat protein